MIRSPEEDFLVTKDERWQDVLSVLRCAAGEVERLFNAYLGKNGGDPRYFCPEAPERKLILWESDH